MDKKGQNTGIVIGLVGGIAFLIIGIVIAFTVVGTLQGSDVIPQYSYSRINESQLNSDTDSGLTSANITAFDVYGVAEKRNAQSFALTSCWSEYYQSNGTATTTDSYGGYNVSLDLTENCTLSSVGNLSSGSEAETYSFPNVSVSYTYTGDNPEILAAGNLSSNFSSGVQKISSKIPTVLLIAVVILVIAVLGVLVAVWKRIRMGQGGQL